MSAIAIAYGTAIGCACLISSIYFYCTMRGQRCYGDDEVENMNRTITGASSPGTDVDDDEVENTNRTINGGDDV